MTGLTFATILHASLVASGAETYAAAVREAEQGKPIVVLVSTEWCGPCQKMEKTVCPGRSKDRQGGRETSRLPHI